MAKKIETISPEDRQKVKTAVDSTGRQAVADALGYRYGTLSDKCTGKLPISSQERDKILQTCKKLKK